MENNNHYSVNNIDFYLLFLSLIFLSLNMTISGIFLLIILFRLRNDLLQYLFTKNVFFPTTEKKILYLFIFYSIIQGIFTINPIFHYAGIIGHYLIYFLIYLIFFSIIKDIEILNKLLNGVMISGCILSFIGILAYFNFLPSFQLFFVPFYGGEYLLNFKTYEIYGKASGFSMNPNIMGIFLFLSFFVALYLKEIKVFEKKIIVEIALIIQIICLILTKSRGAILALFIGIFLILLFNKKSLKKFLPLLVLPILIFIWESQNFLPLFYSILDPLYSTNRQRLETWIISTDIIYNFPYGVGILNYENIYPYYLSANQKYIPHAHNWYIHTAIESGIIGMFLFFTFYFRIIYLFLKKLPLQYIFFPISLFCFSIFNFFDYVLTDNRICILITLIIFSGMKIIENKKGSNIDP